MPCETALMRCGTVVCTTFDCLKAELAILRTSWQWLWRAYSCPLGLCTLASVPSTGMSHAVPPPALLALTWLSELLVTLCCCTQQAWGGANAPFQRVHEV